MESALSTLKIVVTILVIIIVVLWLITIAWVIKDAKARGANKAWGIVAIIPFLGALIYLGLRPSLLAVDKEGLDLDLLLTRRQLMDYGECGRCGYPVEKDYVLCPNCGAQLKNICVNCGKAINPDWSACPYCATPNKGSQLAQRPALGVDAHSAAHSHQAPSSGSLHAQGHVMGASADLGNQAAANQAVALGNQAVASHAAENMAADNFAPDNQFNNNSALGGGSQDAARTQITSDRGQADFSPNARRTSRQRSSVLDSAENAMSGQLGSSSYQRRRQMDSLTSRDIDEQPGTTTRGGRGRASRMQSPQ